MPTIYTTRKGVKILAVPGRKSPFDFKVCYREPRKRERTPRHVHLIIDLYMKRSRNEPLTMSLVNHIINNIVLQVRPSTQFPPRLQIFSPQHVSQFSALDSYGEYDVEFLLVVTELIMIQEKTNYPTGTMNLNLFRKFRNKEDIFSVVSAATFRGR